MTYSRWSVKKQEVILREMVTKPLCTESV